MLFCEGSREGYSSLPLSSLEQLLKIFGIPWFVDCNSNLCLYHHMVLSFLSLPSFYKDTSFIGFRVHPAPSWPHLDLITSSKTLLLNKVTFTGIRVRTWAHPFGVHDSTHTTYWKHFKVWYSGTSVAISKRLVKVTSGLSRWLSSKESACQCRTRGFDPWIRKIPWSRKRQLTPVFLPGKFYGQEAWWSTVHKVTKVWTQLSMHKHTKAINTYYWEVVGRQCDHEGRADDFCCLILPEICLICVAAAAKSLQSCLTLWDPIDGSPLGLPVPGVLQARTLEWVANSFSNAWKWKVKVKSLSRVRLLVTPWTAAYQAPPSMGFSRQECWSGLPLPSPNVLYLAKRPHHQLCFAY